MKGGCHALPQSGSLRPSARHTKEFRDSEQDRTHHPHRLLQDGTSGVLRTRLPSRERARLPAAQHTCGKRLSSEDRHERSLDRRDRALADGPGLHVAKELQPQHSVCARGISASRPCPGRRGWRLVRLVPYLRNALRQLRPRAQGAFQAAFLQSHRSVDDSEPHLPAPDLDRPGRGASRCGPVR